MMYIMNNTETAGDHPCAKSKLSLCKLSRASLCSLLVQKSDTQLAIVQRSRGVMRYDDLYHSCQNPSIKATPV